MAMGVSVEGGADLAVELEGEGVLVGVAVGGGAGLHVVFYLSGAADRPGSGDIEERLCR